ncbi:B12-binding domain-containing protein [Rhodosalinus sp. 5P4]|uniref:cobalamin B12-binding domain-containing protein n=1 Tax=Rhodosalinus sp. 5P4 TaxID=3239196 RepID=UPI00352618D0
MFLISKRKHLKFRKNFLGQKQGATPSRGRDVSRSFDSVGEQYALFSTGSAGRVAGEDPLRLLTEDRMHPVSNNLACAREDERNSGTTIEALAESAIRLLAESRQETAPDSIDGWVERLCDALLAEVETSHQRTITSLVASGFSTDTIHDVIIPRAAARLGDRWVRDEVSFVDVTTGTARLQRILRDRRASGPLPAPAQAAPQTLAILVVVPEFENHALGAFVAADQFNRLGHRVRMAIGGHPDELAGQIAAGGFDMIGVSCATDRAVDRVGALIGHLRAACGSLPPVVVGGQAVGHVPDLLARCGADHAAMTTQGAIEACGLVASRVEPLSMEQSS